MNYPIVRRLLVRSTIATFILTGCSSPFPGENLTARAWVLDGAHSKQGNAAITKTDLAVDPAAQQEFVAVPMPPKEFPENEIAALRTKADLGLAFSGGGNRAAVCALGQIRALSELGVMKRVRYISAVSGGSWFSVPYTFYQPYDDGSKKRTTRSPAGDGTFLGPYIPPGKFDPSLLNKEPLKGSFAHCATNAGMPILPTIRSEHGDENYAHRLNKIYLEPLGRLGNEHRFFCNDLETFAAIHNRNKNLTENDFNIAAPGTPYLIVNTILVRYGLFATRKFTSVEITPNYTGSPAFRRRGILSTFPIGGGYVESFAYDSVVKKSHWEGRDLITDVSLPNRWGLGCRSSPRFSLADTMAASGAAPTVALPKLSYVLGFPQFRHWSPAAVQEGRTAELIHTDGGGIDNGGVIPLLRRKVGTIVAFVNTQMEFNKDNTPKFPDFIGALFGQKQAFYASKKCQVFNASEYGRLASEFARHWNNHDPLIIDQPGLNTMHNELYGVPKNHKVRVIWVFLGGPTEQACTAGTGVKPVKPHNGSLHDWVSSLPPATRAEITKCDSKLFRHFPYFHTFLENRNSLINLRVPQVNALSQYTAYSVMANKELFKPWSD